MGKTWEKHGKKHGKKNGKKKTWEKTWEKTWAIPYNGVFYAKLLSLSDPHPEELL